MDNPRNIEKVPHVAEMTSVGARRAVPLPGRPAGHPCLATSFETSQDARLILKREGLWRVFGFDRNFRSVWPVIALASD